MQHRKHSILSERGSILRKLVWKLRHRSNVRKGSKCLLSLQGIYNTHLWNAPPAPQIVTFGHLPCDGCRHVCLEKRLLRHLVVPFSVLQELKFEFVFWCHKWLLWKCPDVLNSALKQYSWGS